jgi:hypothetical protein
MIRMSIDQDYIQVQVTSNNVHIPFLSFQVLTL